MKKDYPALTENPWGNLKNFTSARIALGRSGSSLPTRERLKFQMSHAKARDAVHQPLDWQKLKEQLDQTLGSFFPEPSLILHSAASDRMEYLRRPDLGRRLSPESRELLIQRQAPEDSPFDLALVLGDGLSSRAIETNAIPFLLELMPLLQEKNIGTAPLSIILQSRVAAADEAAFLLHAQMTVILIGERPGLSSPDSMGLYLTWNPRPGNSTDELRNCISNVRPGGMGYPQAAGKLLYLLEKSRQLKLTGVGLKDDQEELSLPERKGSALEHQ